MENKPIVPVPGDIYRHVKSGGLYRILHFALLEKDRTPVVVYQRQDDRALSIWVRPTDEFSDGRFQPAYRKPQPKKV